MSSDYNNNNNKRKRMDHNRGPPPTAHEEVRAHKLYVGNLNVRVTEYMILKLFRQCGTIVKEQFMWHTYGAKRGEPRGFCFVEYSTRAECVKAIDKLNGFSICGRKITVRFVAEQVEASEGTKAAGVMGTGTGTAAVSAASAAKKVKEGDSSAAVFEESEESIDAQMAIIRQKLLAMEEED